MADEEPWQSHVHPSAHSAVVAYEARRRALLIRAENRQRVHAAVTDPPRRVLDGFGQRRGATWERWARELAQLLEWSIVLPFEIQPNDLDWIADRAQAEADDRWSSVWEYECWRREKMRAAGGRRG